MTKKFKDYICEVEKNENEVASSLSDWMIDYIGKKKKLSDNDKKKISTESFEIVKYLSTEDWINLDISISEKSTQAILSLIQKAKSNKKENNLQEKTTPFNKHIQNGLFGDWIGKRKENEMRDKKPVNEAMLGMIPVPGLKRIQELAGMPMNDDVVDTIDDTKIVNDVEAYPVVPSTPEPMISSDSSAYLEAQDCLNKINDLSMEMNIGDLKKLLDSMKMAHENMTTKAKSMFSDD
ncbi:MAG: hypothetical protein WC284_07815 [Candidimonas sp.]